MPDWTKTMQQYYEYYIVDPNTWCDVKRIDVVKSSSIERDGESETLGSATFDVTESVGECYIRTYLITIQNGVTEKIPLGTHLVQTPSSTFNGKILDVSMDAYTPLIELKEGMPPIGYARLKGEHILNAGYEIVRDNVRAPVIKPVKPEQSTNPTNTNFLNVDFIADSSETWSSYVRALIANDRHKLDLDEKGQILFTPDQDIESMQPVWTYTDDNSSILYPDVTLDHDLFGIPNVVEVVYSKGGSYVCGYAENNDPNSPVSIPSRGRRIMYRETNPSVMGVSNPTVSYMNTYAKQLLKQLSTVEYTIRYTHGYCPVRVGDCVRFNYTRSMFNNIKAKVVSQNIKCVPGCPVTEKAIYTAKLWG